MNAGTVALKLVEAIEKAYNTDDELGRLFDAPVVKTGDDAQAWGDCDAVIIAESWPFEWAMAVPCGYVAKGVYAEPYAGYALAFYRDRHAEPKVSFPEYVKSFREGFSQAIRMDVGEF